MPKEYLSFSMDNNFYLNFDSHQNLSEEILRKKFKSNIVLTI